MHRPLRAANLLRVDASRSKARATRALVGFYAACTVFGVAITVTAVAWILFPTAEGLRVLGWVGLSVGVLAALATWHQLRVMRLER
jgi:hypothetical protein